MTDEIKSVQKAGSHSTQIVNVGIGVAEANQIIDLRIANEFGELLSTVEDLVVDQLHRFKEGLVTALVEEGQLSAVANPNFWKAIQMAAVEAAGADNERDIDLLVDLLVERAKVPDDRRRKAAIEAATKAIGLLDEETLTAISTIFAAINYRAAVANPATMLRLRARVLRKVSPNGFPDPQGGWIDHGVLLGALRIVPGLRPYSDIQQQMAAYYLSPGIEEGGASYDEAIRLASEVGYPSLAVGHPYKDGFAVSPFGDAEILRQYLIRERGMALQEAAALASKMQEAWQIGEVDEKVRQQFLSEYSSERELVEFGDWMSKLNPATMLTEVGSIVGAANLKRLEPAYLDKVIFIDPTN